MVKIAGIVYGKDDAETLSYSLASMIKQTFPLSNIIYVDDGSSDESVEIAEKHGVSIIKNVVHHKSWAGTRNLCIPPNIAIQRLETEGYDYFLINGADVVLEETYVEKLLKVMEANRKVVLASGIIKDEPYALGTPKGAGRIHRSSWWYKYIWRYPYCYSWEAYPIHKAQMLGYKTVCIPDAEMTALRETVRAKGNWGKGMRELGYLPHYALLRCIRSFATHPRSTIKMFVNYFWKPCKFYDSQVAFWLRYQQATSLVRWLKRRKII